MKRLIAILALFVMFSGCSGEQLVTRRFKSMQWNTNPPKDLIELKATPIASPSSAPPQLPPAILLLSERGQVSYIDAAKQFKDLKKSDDLLNLLAKPFPKNVPAATGSGMADRTTIDTFIVLSVKKIDAVQLTQNDPVTPADRITKLELKLRCQEDWYRLHKWDKLGTVYGVIDLGKITHESSGSFNAKLVPKLSADIMSGSIGTDGEIGLGKSDKINEELALKARRIDVSGILTPKEGIIIQQGGIDRDLEGNTSVALTIKMDGRTVYLMNLGELFDDNDKPKMPSEISLKIIPTRIPYWHEKTKGVIMEASADYLFRHVKEGKDSVIEGDDVVTLYKSKAIAQEKIVVLNYADLLKQSQYYRIQDDKKEVVHITNERDTYVLALANINESKAFKKWLKSLSPKQFPVRIGKGTNNWRLLYNEHELRHEDVKRLERYPVSKKSPM